MKVLEGTSDATMGGLLSVGWAVVGCLVVLGILTILFIDTRTELTLEYGAAAAFCIGCVLGVAWLGGRGLAARWVRRSLIMSMICGFILSEVAVVSGVVVVIFTSVTTSGSAYQWASLSDLSWWGSMIFGSALIGVVGNIFLGIGLGVHAYRTFRARDMARAQSISDEEVDRAVVDVFE